MIEYEIYLRTYESPNSPGKRDSYTHWMYKTILLMKKTFDKPVSKKSKILLLVRKISASGKQKSQLVRYKIFAVGNREPFHWDFETKSIVNDEKIPTITIEIAPNQNEDYLCYNCMNYQHKRCKRILMQNTDHLEPCNCRKCWK